MFGPVKMCLRAGARVCVWSHISVSKWSSAMSGYLKLAIKGTIPMPKF